MYSSVCVYETCVLRTPWDRSTLRLVYMLRDTLGPLTSVEIVQVSSFSNVLINRFQLVYLYVCVNDNVSTP